MGNGRSRTKSTTLIKHGRFSLVNEPVDYIDFDYSKELKDYIQKEHEYAQANPINNPSDMDIQKLCDDIGIALGQDMNLKLLTPAERTNLALGLEAMVGINDAYKKITGENLITKLSFNSRQKRPMGYYTNLRSSTGRLVSLEEGGGGILITKYAITLDSIDYMNKNSTGGLWSSLPTLTGVFSHELGHALFDRLKENPATRHLTEAYRNVDRDFRGTSSYGNGYSLEAWAEVFATYTMGFKQPYVRKSAPKTVKEVTELTQMGNLVSAFEKMMKEVGMESLFGSAVPSKLKSISKIASTPTVVSKPVSIPTVVSASTPIRAPRPMPTPTTKTPTSQSSVTVNIKGKGSYTFSLDSTEISRGFTVKEIDGKTYRVYVDGKYTTW